MCFVLQIQLLYINKDELNISLKDAEATVNQIKGKYKDELSIGMEKELGIARKLYFENVWNINARNFIEPQVNLRDSIEEIRKYYRCVLVSDAPNIWIKNVLNELNILDIFDGSIFSGEGHVRKSLLNAFDTIIENLGYTPKNCISIGDQENSDILPARQLGMTTIIIDNGNESLADYKITSVIQLPSLLRNIDPEIFD